MSNYGVFSGPYFPVFELNIGKYGPEKTPYLDTFHQFKLENSLSLDSLKKVLPKTVDIHENYAMGTTDILSKGSNSI